jgi:methyltransferase-like protein
VQDALFGSVFLARQPETQALLDSLSTDFIRQEQYFDFLTNGRFRRSLLCHRDVVLARSPRPDALRRMQVIGLARPQKEAPGASPGGAEEFRSPAGAVLTSNNPVVTTTLHALAEVAPRPLGFENLCRQVLGRLQGVSGAGTLQADRLADFLKEFLLQAWQAGLVELHTHVAALASEPGARPLASPWARHEAEAGSTRVTNLLHRRVELAALERLVLAQLNGQNDRAALEERLSEATAQVKSATPPVDLLDKMLRRFAEAALLLENPA